MKSDNLNRVKIELVGEKGKGISSEQGKVTGETGDTESDYTYETMSKQSNNSSTSNYTSDSGYDSDEGEDAGESEESVEADGPAENEGSNKGELIN